MFGVLDSDIFNLDPDPETGYFFTESVTRSQIQIQTKVFQDQKGRKFTFKDFNFVNLSLCTVPQALILEGIKALKKLIRYLYLKYFKGKLYLVSSWLRV